LVHDSALEIQDGKLNLNPSICWVDSWAFERILNKADSAFREKDSAKTDQLTAKALAMYQGAFLTEDDFAVWAVSKREHLRYRFLSMVSRQAKALASSCKWETAAAHYSRYLEVDDLAEEAYRQLMICLDKMGRRSEALAVFGRCEKVLKAGLGHGPSPETEMTYQSLKT
jgi:DNA-binding SARP family transcriptional activator